MLATSKRGLLLRRLLQDWVLLVGVFSGIVVSVGLTTAGILYLTSIERLAYQSSLDSLASPNIAIRIFAQRGPLVSNVLETNAKLLNDAIQKELSGVYLSHERYLQSSNYLVGFPDNPLPNERDTGDVVARGYLQTLSGLEKQSEFVEGRMAMGGATESSFGPVIEAVVSTRVTSWFDISIGDEMVLIRDIGAKPQVTVKIVGVLEPVDPENAYWENASAFLGPPPQLEGETDVSPVYQLPPVGVAVNPSEPFVPFFVKDSSLVEIGKNSPLPTRVRTLWFIRASKQGFRELTLSETRVRLDAFEQNIHKAIPGTSVKVDAIPGLLENVAYRTLFSKIPLLLLLTLMVATGFFFMAMGVSYVVQARKRDMGLLRTRGVGLRSLLGIYATEGFGITCLALVSASLVAVLTVPLLGKLPLFRDTTMGEMLPITYDFTTFLMAAAVGTGCLVIYIVCGTVSARVGMLSQKLLVSRPPGLSIFHHYFLDIALALMVGLAFWEIRSSGQFVAEGPLHGPTINETLVIVPVLFLIVVTMAFMRLFPLAARFLGGESPAFMHWMAAGVFGILIPVISTKGIRGEGVPEWPGLLGILIAFIAAYWATNRSTGTLTRIIGLLAQSSLAYLFLKFHPFEPGISTFIPTLGMLFLVPFQILFLALKMLGRTTPIWFLMSIRRMGRDPARYTWFVLLLVLITGLTVLAATIGATLDQNQRDRALYEVGSDIRITGFSRLLAGGMPALEERYAATVGIQETSLAVRSSGNIGPANMEVLGLQSKTFPYLSWYRDDFSEESLVNLVNKIQPIAELEKIEIPKEAETISVWVKAEEAYPMLTLVLQIANRDGGMTPVYMGRLNRAEWQLMTAKIPILIYPARLISFHVEELTGAGTPGSILLDDIQIETDENILILDDFETKMRWSAIRPPVKGPDKIAIVGDSKNGKGAGKYAFGTEMTRGVRGAYLSPEPGPMPVIASLSLLKATGLNIGEIQAAQISGRTIDVEIRDVVNFFPTMAMDGEAFLIADLETLLAHINILGSQESVKANELFVKRKPGSNVGHIEALGLNDSRFVKAEELNLKMETMRLDPLLSAAWETLVLVSLGVVLVSAGLGYGLYLLLISRIGRAELGFLRSIGLSKRQMFSMIGFEHLTIVLLGTGLGTWAGFQMSRLMVAPLAVTDLGEEVIPPFVLLTDWQTMLLTYGALAFLFCASLSILLMRATRLDVKMIARAEEY